MNLNDYAETVHRANERWWKDLETGESIKRNVGELLMLCVSELSEAMEGHRKNLMDDKLPHRPMFEVEIVDTLIRLFDIAKGFNIDLERVFQEKMTYNASRVDHTKEHRLSEHGKKY
jgi:NTP pyrophosphatase (non-canonical NTP hydrolase)